jgi:hypothetical protein
MTSNSTFPQFVSAGDILTDLIRTGDVRLAVATGRRRLERRTRRRAARFADGMCRFARHRQFLR